LRTVRTADDSGYSSLMLASNAAGVCGCVSL
jgi:hypothetical protein